MSRPVLFLLVGLVLGLIVVGIVVVSQPYTFRGSLFDPAVSVPEFALASTDGGTYRLRDDRGKIVLLFFGYTTCPDVCPATLSEMKELRRRLQGDAEQVQVVFVTVDPQRDTLERMGQYVSTFDPSFVGLTGSETELEPVWQSFGVFRAIQEQDSAVEYLVDHSSRVYLIDREGNLRLTYAFGTPVDDLLADIRYLVKEKGQ